SDKSSRIPISSSTTRILAIKRHLPFFRIIVPLPFFVQRGRRLGKARQEDGYASPPFTTVRNIDATAVLFDNFFNYSKSQARSACFGRDVRLENPRQHLRREAAAIVRDGKPNAGPLAFALGAR